MTLVLLEYEITYHKSFFIGEGRVYEEPPSRGREVDSNGGDILFKDWRDEQSRAPHELSVQSPGLRVSGKTTQSWQNKENVYL